MLPGLAPAQARPHRQAHTLGAQPGRRRGVQVTGGGNTREMTRILHRTVYSLENSSDNLQRELVDTLVLESPFNNLHDEIKHVVFESKGVLRQDIKDVERLKHLIINIDHRRALGKLAPVIIDSMLGSSDMVFR